jgi:mRNA-degrading endonuclease YafQ of YafQ-DinJ toxin-antitoxin module
MDTVGGVMRTIIERRSSFDKDLERFSKSDKKSIEQSIEKLSHLFQTNQEAFYRNLNRLKKYPIFDDCELSLYTFRVRPDIRAILSVDEDPIFEQTVITLRRVTRPDNLIKTLDGVAQSVYQEVLNGNR